MNDDTMMTIDKWRKIIVMMKTNVHLLIDRYDAGRRKKMGGIIIGKLIFCGIIETDRSKPDAITGKTVEEQCREEQNRLSIILLENDILLTDMMKPAVFCWYMMMTAETVGVIMTGDDAKLLALTPSKVTDSSLPVFWSLTWRIRNDAVMVNRRWWWRKRNWW